jgi:hypothetical protein
MSNLSTVQFSAKDWNPFLGAANFIDSLRPKEDEKDKNKSKETSQESHTEETSSTERETPTPENTGAPTPKNRGSRVRQQGPINPSTTGAPMPRPLKSKTATHPITGAKVPRVPTKPRIAKPTAPGTRPKNR